MGQRSKLRRCESSVCPSPKKTAPSLRKISNSCHSLQAVSEGFHVRTEVLLRAARLRDAPREAYAGKAVIVPMVYGDHYLPFFSSHQCAAALPAAVKIT